jgi:hypothetical protein
MHTEKGSCDIKTPNILSPSNQLQCKDKGKKRATMQRKANFCII